MEQTFETPGPLRLALRVPAGAIEVEATDTGRTEVRLEGDAELLETAIVELRGDELRVEIPERTSFLSFGRREVLVTIRCPAGSAAAVRTKSADLRVRGVLGRTEVATASGDVELERAASLSVRSASGDVRADDVEGDAVVNTASGDVELGRVGGSLSANLVSGDLRAREVAGSVAATSVSGDQRLEAVTAGTVTASTVSGDVEVGIRRGSRVHVDASTLSGDTRSELDLGEQPAEGDGPTIDLRVKTVSGDVAVVRAPAPTPQEVDAP